MNFQFNTEQSLCKGIKEFCDFYGIGTNGGILIKGVLREGNLSVRSDGKIAEIFYPEKSAFFYGLSFCMQNYGKKFAVERDYSVKKLGIMRDCAKNAVLSAQGARTLTLCAAALGYNYIGLYVEDLIEVKDYPYFGALRGRYSNGQIKEIISYADLFGIEVVPFIQTLGHLSNMFKKDAFFDINDIDDILLTGKEETYYFLDAVIRTVSQTFSAKRINLGTDGAYALGMGKYLTENGYLADRSNIFIQHLQKVVKICRKYGMNPEIWSDTAFKLGLKIKENSVYAHCAGRSFDKNFKHNFPENVALRFWDCNAENACDYEKIIDKHFELSDKVYFAGGLGTHNGFAPSGSQAISRVSLAAESCIKRGCADYCAALWGGEGECSSFAAAGALLWFAEKIRGGTVDKSGLDAKCFALFGNTYSEFAEIDIANGNDDASPVKSVNSSKYLFYNDLLCGVADAHANGKTKEKFLNAAERLAAIGQKKGKFAYIFDYLSVLCRIVAKKGNLGNEISRAYKMNDKEFLLRAAEETIPELIAQCKEFYEKYKTAWLKENKSYGLEIFQIRLGGLTFRMERCAQTILEYLSGKRDGIESLVAERLPFYPSTEGEDVYYNDYKSIATGSLI